MTDIPIKAHAEANTEDFVRSITSMTAVLSTLRVTAGLTGASIASMAGVAMVAGIQRAAEFQTELVKINTLVGISATRVAEFRQQILDLAPAMGATAPELTRALFAITSGGERGSGAMELLEQSAKAAAVGLGDMTEIGRTATAAMQAFAHDNLTATQAVDVMLATVREGNLVAEELAIAFGRVIGIAATMGVTFDEVGAFMATFTRLGVSAEVAATSLRAALTAILNPGKEARETFESIGFTVEQMRSAIQDDGLTSAFIQMLEAAQGNQDVIGNLIPNIRALAGVLGTAGVQAKQYVEVQESIANSHGLTNEGFETVQDNLDITTQKFKVAVDTLLTRLGQSALPEVTEFVQDVNEFIAAVDNIAEKIKKLGDVMSGDMTFVFDAMEGIKFISTEALTAQERLAKMREVASQHTTATLQDLRAQLQADQERLGGMMIAGTSDNEDLARFNRNHQRLKAINSVLKERAEMTPTVVEGLRVIVGQTDEQREATERLIQSMEEEQLRLQENERQILLNRMSRLDLTQAQRATILQLFEENQAIEEQIEVRKDLEMEMARNARARQRFNERMQRESVRLAARKNREEFEKEMEAARIATEIELARIEERMERLADVVQAMSQSIVSGLISMVDGTKKVGPAFAEMVSSILIEMARLKLEQDIIGPLLRSLFFSIPSAPAPIPLPDVDVSMPTVSEPIVPVLNQPAGLRSAGSMGASAAPQIIVQATVSPQLNFVDSRDGRRFIQEQGGEIVKLVRQAVTESVAIGREFQ